MNPSLSMPFAPYDALEDAFKDSINPLGGVIAPPGRCPYSAHHVFSALLLLMFNQALACNGFLCSHWLVRRDVTPIQCRTVMRGESLGNVSVDVRAYHILHESTARGGGSSEDGTAGKVPLMGPLSPSFPLTR